MYAIVLKLFKSQQQNVQKPALHQVTCPLTEVSSASISQTHLAFEKGLLSFSLYWYIAFHFMQQMNLSFVEIKFL